MPQIKDIAITKSIARDDDFLIMQNPETGETYKITKGNLFAGFSGSGDGSSNNRHSLNFVSNGDASGLFYYLGTNKGTSNWINPAGTSVNVTASSTEAGNPTSLIDRQGSEWFSHPIANSWVSFAITSGKLLCNYYSIRSRATNTDYYPRNWKLQGSNDGATWIDLDIQVNNETLNAVSQWLSLPVSSNTSYSNFRIIQNGLDSSNADYFCLGEFELYGSYSS
ncbi:MAG: hypothetical protein V7K32_00310 [Nostoc sp.]|uniref:hypothetical protein n=1 Tax=Nostoc sp. TaxID=1180 RepID=UPI002FF6C330